MLRLSRSLAFFASFAAMIAAPISAEPQSSGEAEPPIQSPAATEAKPEPTGMTFVPMKVVRSSKPGSHEFIAVEMAQIPEEPTRILDKKGADRLMRNEGATLQWIDWDTRGPVWVAVTTSDHWVLRAGQYGENGGALDVDGFITEIGEDYFVLQGTIKILGTPDRDRVCEATKPWRFAVTQNRSYYRLREFEWCDYLTDYIDIYFPPALR